MKSYFFFALYMEYHKQKMYYVVYMIWRKPFGSKYIEPRFCTVKIHEKLKTKSTSGNVFIALKTWDIGCFPTYLPPDLFLWRINFVSWWLLSKALWSQYYPQSSLHMALSFKSTDFCHLSCMLKALFVFFYISMNISICSIFSTKSCWTYYLTLGLLFV